ncbi:MAG TPA: hypothetical protein VKT78_09270 [Fimbriimonadaceae bacterium]|nr:hypothetical protein [Fimbriimonadaceae bacterium]
MFPQPLHLLVIFAVVLVLFGGRDLTYPPVRRVLGMHPVQTSLILAVLITLFGAVLFVLVLLERVYHVGFFSPRVTPR